MGQLAAQPRRQPIDPPPVCLHLCHCFLYIIKHDGLIGEKVRVPIENLVEEVAAVVGGKLGVPDHSGDLPDTDWPHRILSVVYAEAGVKVNGILFDLPLH